MTVPRSLAERRLSVLQFQADLRELVKVWGTPGKLGAEIGFSAVSITNQMKGYQPATSPMCEKLYGPGHGNRLIVRGPDGRPVDRRWVGEPEAEPVRTACAVEDAEDEELDDVEAGVARIAAIVARKPETDQPASQLPSTPEPLPEEAPAAETVEAAGPPTAGLETDPGSEPGAGTAAGDGAAVDHPEIPAGPDVAPIADVTEDPEGDAGKAVDDTQAPKPEDGRPLATTAPVPGGAVTPTDLSQHPMAQPATVTPSRMPGILPAIESTPGQPLADGQEDFVPVAEPCAFDVPALPHWSQIEDHDLVAILRGKAAGIAAEMAELAAEAVTLGERVADLHTRSRKLEARRAQLLVTIDHFETEEGSLNGDESEAA